MKSGAIAWKVWKKCASGKSEDEKWKPQTTFEIDTWLGKKNKINAITKDDFYLTISKKNIRNIKVTLNYEGPIVAPINKGEKIGEIIVKNKDEVVKKLPLFAAEDLKKVNFFRSLFTSINYLIWGDA